MLKWRKSSIVHMIQAHYLLLAKQNFRRISVRGCSITYNNKNWFNGTPWHAIAIRKLLCIIFHQMQFAFRNIQNIIDYT